jgi:hypothetical protein
MENKHHMSPKTAKLQEYYETIFSKRFFQNKIFYYLPIGCKVIYTTYKDLENTNNIERFIIYRYINDKLVLVEDSLYGWFGELFLNFHTPESPYFTNYERKLQEFCNDENHYLEIII